MSFENYHEEINNVNEYFEALEGIHQDILLLVAICDDGSRYFNNINFGPYAEDMAVELGFREGFAAIIDHSSEKSIRERGKKAYADYEWNGHRFGARSSGFVDNSNKGYAYFTIDRKEYRLYGNRGLNALIFSKSENRAIDVFSVDTYADPSLKINRYSSSKIIDAIDSWDVCPHVDIPQEVLCEFFKEKSNKICIQHLDSLISIFRARGASAERDLINLMSIRDTEADRKEVIKILKKLAKDGDGECQKKLGRLYREGRGVHRDINVSIKWMRKAWDKRKISSWEYVDTLLMSKNPNDYRKAYRICKAGSEDDPRLKRTLWSMYWNGIGTDRDIAKAEAMIRKHVKTKKISIINGVLEINPELYDYDEVYAWYSSNKVSEIIADCIVSNIRLDGCIRAKNIDEIMPAVPGVIDENTIGWCDDIKRAIILFVEDYSEFIHSNVKGADIFFKGITETKSHADARPLYVRNHECDGLQTIVDVDKGNVHRNEVSFGNFIEFLNAGGDSGSVIIDSDDWIEITKVLDSRSVTYYIDIEKHITNKSKIIMKIKQYHLISLEYFTYQYMLGKGLYQDLPREGMPFLFDPSNQLGDLSRNMCKNNSREKKSGIIINSNFEDIITLMGYENSISLPTDCKMALDKYIGYEQKYYEESLVTTGPRNYFPGNRMSTENLALAIGDNRNSGIFAATEVSISPLINYDKMNFYKEAYDLQLKYENVVILNPYGSTFTVQNPDYGKDAIKVLEQFADILLKKGYRIYTNSINDTQPAIRGSEVLRCSLFDLAHISKRCNCIVTVFTGLMEFLMLTESNVAVITPNKRESRLDISKQCVCNYQEHYLDEASDSEIINRLLSFVEANKLNPQGHPVFTTNLVDIKELNHVKTKMRICAEYPQFRGFIFDSLRKLRGSQKEHLLKQLTENGSVVASYFLSLLYLKGIHVDKDEKLAAKYMTKCISGGATWASNELFDILWRIGTPEAHEEMITVATAFAETGDGNAMGRLGRAYRDGRGVEQDLGKAAEWMRKAADKNVGWANELFDVLWRIGTPEAHEEMITVATAFAETGDGNAMGRLGRAYRDGKGVGKDLNRAIEWTRKAKDNNINWANQLHDYLWERGMSGDYEEAFKGSLTMAEQGDPWAAVHIALSYRYGKGVNKDLGKAIEWMQKASDKNNEWAKKEVAFIIEEY